MKNNYLPAIAIVCATLSLAAVALLLSVGQSQASLATGQPVFGSTQLTFSGTGTSTLNLSGTAQTSIPCKNMLLSITGTGVLIGSTSSTATFPISGAPAVYYPVSNVNQVWCYGTSANKVDAVYLQ